MRHFLAVFTALLILSGCVTQKRCLLKFPPQTDTIRSSVIEYRDTTVTVSITADTVIKYEDVIMPFDITKIKPAIAETEYARAEAMLLENNSDYKLQLTLQQKSKQIEYRLDSVIVYKRDTIQITNVIEKPVANKTSKFWIFGFFILFGLLIIIYIIK